MRRLRHLLIATLIGLVFCGCGNAAGPNTGAPMQATKGALQGMKTNYMGRFAIDLPETFELEIQSQKFRYAEIEEIVWPQNLSRESARMRQWEKRISEIKDLQKPHGIDDIILKNVELNIGNWCSAVLYYGNYMSELDGNWDVLVDIGNIGLWIKLSGLIEYEKEMLDDMMEIAKSYKYLEPAIKPMTISGFCLQYGVIELPYLEQESTYARFAGPMGMKLEIDMNETHEVEEAGLLESFAASVATNFAPGLDVDKIRGGKRMVAGLVGEEIVTKLTADMGPKLYFGWKYQGKKDSGEHPEIRIAIQKVPEDDLNEKYKIWDCALDSFKPVYKR